MSRTRLLALSIMLLVSIAVAAPAGAQQDPLLGGQATASPDEPTAPLAANQGLLHRLEGDVVLDGADHRGGHEGGARIVQVDALLASRRIGAQFLDVQHGQF